MRRPAELAAQPEDPGIPAELMSTGSYFDKGLPVQPWSLRVSNGTDTTRITTVPVEAVGGRVKVSAVDDTVQEGARRFVFDGSGQAAVQITSEGAVDVSRESNGDVMLLVRLRRDADVPKDVKLGMSLRRRVAAAAPFADTLAGLRRRQVADRRRAAQVLREGRRRRDQGQRDAVDRVGEQARPVDLAGQARHRRRQELRLQLNGDRPRFLENGARPDADEEGALVRAPLLFSYESTLEARPRLLGNGA